MTSLTSASWSEALLLLDDAYTLVLVGSRAHQDWRQDVIPIMRREARDPRGWDSIIPEEYERTIEGPFWPFKPIEPQSLDKDLNPITPDSAAKLLVAMSHDESFNASRIPGFPGNREDLLDQAHTLLSRFPPKCQLYTNSGYAWENPDHDYLESASQVNSYVVDGLDLGLIAVAEDEVGFFWSIDAR